MGFSCCNKSSSEKSKKPPRKKKESKKWNPLECLVCRGEKAMCGFCGAKPPDENKESSSNARERKEGKKRGRLACLACRGERAMGCSCCAKSSDDENNKPSRKTKEWKEGKKRNRLACLVCRGERVMGSSFCAKSSDQNKGSSRNVEEGNQESRDTCLACRGERVVGCAYCEKSSEESKKHSRGAEERKEKKTKVLLACLVCRGRERGMICSCCAKSSDVNKKFSRKKKERKEGRGTEESIEERKEDQLACLVCRGRERGISCFGCTKSSDENKKSSRKTKERKEGRGTEERIEERKEDRLTCLVCRGQERGIGCSCSVKSSDENKKSSRKKKEREEGRGTEERKEERKEDRLTCLVCRGWERGMGCFCCAKSSDENKKSSRKTKERKEARGTEERKEERKKDRLTCLVCRGWERGICCAKSSDDNKKSSKKMKKRDEGRGLEEKKEERKEDRLACLVCRERERGMGCSCGAESSDENKKSSRKTKERKEGITLLVCRGRKRGTCRICCVKSFDKNKEPTRKKNEPRKGSQLAFLINSISFKSDNGRQRSEAEAILRIGNGSIAARIFQFREMAAATKNFRAECLLGEGGFGRVYKGTLEDTNQIVAVKQLDRNGLQGSREFLIEVLMLSLLHHPNLVKLLGYCADGDQRILVYEYMPLGSLEDHLLDPSPNRKPLDWSERMKIALGAAKGLEYLHDVANPPVIYRDFKASNILLDHDYNPKLSDFGLAKLGPVGDKSHVSTRVMGTYGYCAPEYALTGQLTKMSDVYSFGVLFLEMITGRRAFDITRPRHEQQLVQWAGPLFRDKRKFAKMADPLLQGKYPLKCLYQAVAVSAMCLQDEASTRPRISDVVTALEYLSLQADESREGPKEYTAPQELTPPGSEIETDTGSDTGGSNTEEILQSQ